MDDIRHSLSGCPKLDLVLIIAYYPSRPCIFFCSSVHDTGAAQPSPLVTLPDATTPAAFMKWANSLPATNPPTWLGLALNAEAALSASRGEQLLSNWQVSGPFHCFGRCRLHSRIRKRALMMFILMGGKLKEAVPLRRAF